LLSLLLLLLLLFVSGGGRVVISIVIADPAHYSTADKCIPTVVQTVEAAMLYNIMSSTVLYETMRETKIV